MVSSRSSPSRCSGIEREQIVKQLNDGHCPAQTWEKGGRIYSCSDAIVKAVERHGDTGAPAHSHGLDAADIAKSLQRPTAREATRR